ncbi:uncharacterized protein AMSG_10017 [Thecamonas trahens ATCC 50062]|uniref:Uncharacterized protein n=1 Tax=Thecamonas trahens ATCC 50062 TaxID=461836 RepID=A0A0L0DPP4_THETB|nr:hypothetical protein AMSG_10017 [Thecamonas trahens ATCC 50062]KNC54225.1 hypothetical protein AMSG_10017 [Thecamonas trahens ATCC 50062]|eukprot:XP_013753863.1 hypothetical protein AMSG_10017 [Thecamonas trahens ATCC 50062]
MEWETLERLEPPRPRVFEYTEVLPQLQQEAKGECVRCVRREQVADARQTEDCSADDVAGRVQAVLASGGAASSESYRWELAFRTAVTEVSESRPHIKRAEGAFALLDQLARELRPALANALKAIKDELEASVYSDDFTSTGIRPYYTKIPYFGLCKRMNVERLSHELVLHSERDELESALLRKSDEVEELRQLFLATKRELGDVRSRLEAAEGELDKAQAKLGIAHDDLDDARNALAVLRGEYEDALEILRDELRAERSRAAQLRGYKQLLEDFGVASSLTVSKDAELPAPVAVQLAPPPPLPTRFVPERLASENGSDDEIIPNLNAGELSPETMSEVTRQAKIKEQLAALTGISSESYGTRNQAKFNRWSLLMAQADQAKRLLKQLSVLRMAQLAEYEAATGQLDAQLAGAGVASRNIDYHGPSHDELVAAKAARYSTFVREMAALETEIKQLESHLEHLDLAMARNPLAIAAKAARHWRKWARVRATERSSLGSDPSLNTSYGESRSLSRRNVSVRQSSDGSGDDRLSHVREAERGGAYPSRYAIAELRMARRGLGLSRDHKPDMEKLVKTSRHSELWRGLAARSLSPPTHARPYTLEGLLRVIHDVRRHHTAEVPGMYVVNDETGDWMLQLPSRSHATSSGLVDGAYTLQDEFFDVLQAAYGLDDVVAFVAFSVVSAVDAMWEAEAEIGFFGRALTAELPLAAWSHAELVSQLVERVAGTVPALGTSAVAAAHFLYPDTPATALQDATTSLRMAGVSLDADGLRAFVRNELVRGSEIRYMSMLDAVRRYDLLNHGWLTEAEFLDCMEVSLKTNTLSRLGRVYFASALASQKTVSAESGDGAVAGATAGGETLRLPNPQAAHILGYLSLVAAARQGKFDAETAVARLRPISLPSANASEDKAEVESRKSSDDEMRKDHNF